ncbi:MAG: TMEM165/GDT1 family protein [Candidatus Methanomethylophilaceae archaeon]|nr:TMEM165/GDT1 family protein [Candidatus Methanomethylophilaceae archaeon]
MVAVTELGDKSSLAVITMASRYDRKAVFLGSFSALMLMTVFAIALGSVAAEYLPRSLLLGMAAALFLAFGILSWRDVDEDSHSKDLKNKSVALGSFLLLMVMEMGDKTQISVLSLSATGDWLPVLLGAGSAFFLLVGAACLLGNALAKRIDPARMTKLSGALFLVFGLAYSILLWIELFS